MLQGAARPLVYICMKNGRPAVHVSPTITASPVTRASDVSLTLFLGSFLFFFFSLSFLDCLLGILPSVLGY